MAHTPTVGEARWTAAHRAFPLLTGSGVVVALLVFAWIPPPRWIAFFALPLLIAPPLGALSIWGTRNIASWMAGRHAIVALAAAATAMVPAALAAALTHAHADSTFHEPADFAAIIASVAALAGWLALQFERIVDRGTGLPRLGATRWNPRRWGIAGAAGVALCLAALTVPAWALFISGPLGTGPVHGTAWFYALFAGIGALVSLMTGLVLEAAREPVRRQPHEA